MQLAVQPAVQLAVQLAVRLVVQLALESKWKKTQENHPVDPNEKSEKSEKWPEAKTLPQQTRNAEIDAAKILSAPIGEPGRAAGGGSPQVQDETILGEALRHNYAQ